MSYLYEVDKRNIATVALNRPTVHNALNGELIAGLTEVFEKIGTNKAIRLVVLKGEGKSFCAGADINHMKETIHYSSEENYQDALILSKLFQTINSCPVPVLGKVHGAVLGGGGGLVSVCDYVVASQEAKFGFTEVRLGLIPAVISPFVLAKIGANGARATFLSGKRFDASEALKLGLVHEVCSPQKLDETVENNIEHFLQTGPFASRKAKALINHVSPVAKETLIRDTCKMIADIRVSSEAQEGMAALLAKRKPEWIGPCP